MYRSIILGILLFGLSAQAQTSVPSVCEAPDSVKVRYAHDAAWMAFSHLLDQDSTYINGPHLPQSLQDTFMRALLAVYNARLPARDTVVYGLKYYTSHSFSLDRVSIFGGTTTPWIVRLTKKIDTGHPSVDSIIAAYGITVQEVFFMGTFIMLTLQTDKFYNTEAISKLFNAVSFGAANPYFSIGDGDRITGKMHKSEIHLTYSIGWGDCQAGCISRRYFRFIVYPDCSVRFDTSYGSKLGGIEFPDAGVEDNPARQSTLHVSPNPASESVTISSTLFTQLEIVNTDGRVVKKIILTEPRSEISIADLPKGLYFISPYGRQGETVKFIKQ